MISRSDIEAAARRINRHVRRTPILRLDGADLDLGHPLALKLELFQHTGSFKARGAFNTLLTAQVPDAGIVAASGGNHGAAVAFAAARLGHRAKIFVPEIAGATKIGLIQATGADCSVVPGAYADAAEAAAAYQAETGAMSIHPYDGEATLTGQGTMAKEIEADLPDLDILLIAVGGGGLIGGALSWYRDRVRVVAVEPERAPTLAHALRDGPDAEVAVGGVAANSLGAKRIGAMAYQAAKELGTETVLVPDAAITQAQHKLWGSARILAEPGGAAALAALTCGAFVPPRGARVGVVVCGGNIDPGPFG